jgi:CBS domain containing-hemolysin-like protein
MAELTVLAVIAVLIAVNGLFVAAEFAIIGTSRAAMKARAARGDSRARRVSAVLDDPVRQDRFIATAQLGITLASLGLGMYGEHAVADWILRGFDRAGWGAWAGAHAVASVLAIGRLSYLHVVLGEMVPKSLALAAGRRHRRGGDRADAVDAALLQPLVLALNGVGNGLLRLVGIDRRAASGPPLHVGGARDRGRREPARRRAARAAGPAGARAARLLRADRRAGDGAAGPRRRRAARGDPRRRRPPSSTASCTPATRSTTATSTTCSASSTPRTSPASCRPPAR